MAHLFPDSEFNRVTRAAWPFIILTIRSILIEIRARFDAEITSFSTPVKTLQELIDDWNKQFGRYSKLSLDAPSQTADD